MKSIAALLSDWRQSRERMELVERNLPRIIGSEVVKIVKDNFRLEGYATGAGIKKWAQRKSSTNDRYDRRKGVKGSVFNSSAKLMQQTMNLYDAIHYRIEGKNVFVGVNLTLVPYAEIHNEGLTGSAWGKVPFKMPRRQFMPAPGDKPNPLITRAVKAKVDYEVKQTMQNFIR